MFKVTKNLYYKCVKFARLIDFVYFCRKYINPYGL